MKLKSPTTRILIGLPVYNGERFLEESLDSLLAQTFKDFELLISDNASTDGTQKICERYVDQDPRITYVRHPKTLGSAFNHNYVVEQCTAEYFKWASDDDRYDPTLLETCIRALDADPGIVVAHSWTTEISAQGVPIKQVQYSLRTSAPSARERFASCLYDTPAGDDIYGVIRTSTMKAIAPYGSYHLPDRTMVAELSLHGRFYNTPRHLYYRRHHDGRVLREDGIRARAARTDPRRANRLRHPVIRLQAEYILAYLTAIRNSPLTRYEKHLCVLELFLWLTLHLVPRRLRTSWRVRRLQGKLAP